MNIIQQISKYCDQSLALYYYQHESIKAATPEGLSKLFLFLLTSFDKFEILITIQCHTKA